jgi:hypothetical protein
LHASRVRPTGEGHARAAARDRTGFTRLRDFADFTAPGEHALVALLEHEVENQHPGAISS